MDVTRTYEEAVDLMINFWVEKAFYTKMNQDNGGDAFTTLLMNDLSLAAQSKITGAQIDKFKSKLKELLMSKENDNYHLSTELSVDYHPNRLLSEAIEFATIPSACFPCKTHTYIDKNDNFKINGCFKYHGEIVNI